MKSESNSRITRDKNGKVKEPNVDKVCGTVGAQFAGSFVKESEKSSDRTANEEEKYKKSKTKVGGVTILSKEETEGKRTARVKESKHERFSVKIVVILFMIIAGTLATVLLFRTAPSKEIEEIKKVNELREKILLLRGSWETLSEGNPKTLSTVFQQSQELATRLESITNNLDFASYIDRAEYIGYATFMAADAAYRLGKNEKRDSLVDKSISWLKFTQGEIVSAHEEMLRNPTNKQIELLNSNIQKCLDDERVTYLLAMCYALDSLSRGKFSLNDATNELNKIQLTDIQDLQVNSNLNTYIKTLTTNAP